MTHTVLNPTTTQTLKQVLKASVMAAAFAASFGGWAQSELAQTDAINPLTGQSLSSEALARELARVKIEAELSETRAKLAKSQADLALATIRQTIEEKRLTAEMKTGAPVGSGTNASSTLPRLIELPQTLPAERTSSQRSSSGSGQGTAGTLALRASPPSTLESTAPPSAPPQGGHLQIGAERISVSQLSNGRTNTVESADGQTRAPQQLFGQPTPSRQLGMPSLTSGSPVVPPIGGSDGQGSAPAAPMPAMPAFNLE